MTASVLATSNTRDLIPGNVQSANNGFRQNTIFFRAGKIIYRPGDKVRNLYEINHGAIRVYRISSAAPGTYWHSSQQGTGLSLKHQIFMRATPRRSVTLGCCPFQ